MAVRNGTVNENIIYLGLLLKNSRMRSLFVFCISLLIFSCSEKYKKVNLIKLDSNSQKVIPINNLSTEFSILSQLSFREDGEVLFIHLNYFDSDPNYLFVNSLDDPEVDLVLKFDGRGPNEVGGVTDFYFHDYDSIFLIDRYRYQVSLADSSGEVLKRYRLKENDSNMPGEDSVLPWVTSKSRIFKRGRYLYIPCIPDQDPFKSQYKRNNLLIKLDLKSGDYTTLLGYPELYQTGDFWGNPDHILPSISPSDDPDFMLVSFPLADSIYKLNLKTEEMEPYFLMRSDQLDPPVFIDFKDIQSDRMIQYQYGTDYYFSFNYDPFRMLYWRVVYKKYDDESLNRIVNRKGAGKANKKYMIVYDKNLNRIGEFGLDSIPKFGGYDFIILKDGPYISVTPEDVEDEKVFQRIIIE